MPSNSEDWENQGAGAAAGGGGGGGGGGTPIKNQKPKVGNLFIWNSFFFFDLIPPLP